MIQELEKDNARPKNTKVSRNQTRVKIMKRKKQKKNRNKVLVRKVH